MKWDWLLVAGLILSAGCSGESRLPTTRVEFKVLVDDKPFGPCLLTLNPKNPTKTSRAASGSVSADGTARPRTYADREGVIPGQYEALIVRDVSDMKSFQQVPTVKPVAVEVKNDTKTAEAKFTSVKGARPGMIPPPTK